MVMTLARLCDPWGELQLEGDGSVPVTRVTADSRRAGPGSLFVAVRGHVSDGHRYVAGAVASGCSAVLIETTYASEVAAPLAAAPAVAKVTAPNTQPYPALLARELAGRPDEMLKVAAVTGTNGKTTVAYLLRAMLTALVGRCGLLGTLGYDDGDRREAAPLTTPAGEDLYDWLARMCDNSCRAVALELSSHALSQQRAAGLALDVAVLTNLGRDHLDYHGDRARYLAAKAEILELLRPQPLRDKPPGSVALNAADAALAGLDTCQLPAVRFWPRADSDASESADLQLVEAQLSPDGTRLTLAHRGRPLTIRSRLVGRYNVENLTAAVAAGIALGYDAADCAEAVASVVQVPGRMERFGLPSGAMAVVDYAHTPDALAAVLAACEELADGRLIVAFGCGGDRDRGKRPLMGAVAARQADAVWITSDNPRSEDPQRIVDEILTGLTATANPRAASYEVVLDRPAAVRAALASAQAGEVVVVAGKGHEDYQLVGDRRLHLDDREIITTWIERNAADD